MMASPLDLVFLQGTIRNPSTSSQVFQRLPIKGDGIEPDLLGEIFTCVLQAVNFKKMPGELSRKNEYFWANKCIHIYLFMYSHM